VLLSNQFCNRLYYYNRPAYIIFCTYFWGPVWLHVFFFFIGETSGYTPKKTGEKLKMEHTDSVNWYMKYKEPVK
jgi:hypothetical protein